ncbi:MAG: 2,3-bisphosphoglycerate-independent phosphoglycerate mutase, partial [Candidatus Woesebacteria bacterium GW2011_GWC1_43_10b]
MSLLGKLFNKKIVITGPAPSGIKPVVLLVLDGYGIAPASQGNAITQAKKPNIDSFASSYFRGELIASGESVGLPANEVGNTEVGHLSLGAGRTIFQDLVRINKSIKDESFYDNRALLQALDHVKKNNSKFHVIGLVGSGNVHSSIEHFWAIMEFCKRQNLTNVYLHLITDGRDSPPEEGIGVVQKIETQLGVSRIGKVATISGRYFAMDRDKRWERIQKEYEALVLGKGTSVSSAVEALKRSYAAKKSDEFVLPSVVSTKEGGPVATVDDNDAVIFFNFRI